MHEFFCLTDSMSCALAFERRHARIFFNCWYRYVSWHPSVSDTKLNSTPDESQVRVIVLMTLPEDVTRPSTRNVISQTTLLTVCSLNDGNEGAMLSRSTESILVEPEISSRVSSVGSHDQHQKHPHQVAETSECQQNEIRPATFCLEQCATTFWSSGSTGDTSCYATIVPSRVGNAVRRRGAETLMCGAYGQCWFWNSCDEGTGAWAFACCRWWRATSDQREPLTIQRGDIQFPIQRISSRHQVLLHPKDRPLRSKTYAANDTVELYCPWCESLPLTATALSHQTPQNASPTSVITISWWCRAKWSRRQGLETLSNHWCDTRVRTGCVLGAVLCPSCPSWSHFRDSHADQRCSDVWSSSHIQTGNRHFKRLLTLIRDLQKCENPWILTRPLSSHVWRTGPICSLEQHHRCQSAIFDRCAFGTPWKLRTNLTASHCDYQDILAFGGAVKNIMFVLSVAVLTSNYMAKISVDDSLQHVAKFSHPASVPSSAILSLPGKLETDDSVPLCFNKRTSDFGMIRDSVATFQGSALLGWP